MFKKRTRPASVREKAQDSEASSEAGPSKGGATSGEDEEESRTVQELIALRRYRKPTQGIDLERLNQGESKTKRRKLKEVDLGLYGLQPGIKPDEEEKLEDRAATALASRIVSSTNFTQQTNALDTDKHMASFIEQELAKRRGGQAAVDLLKPKDEADYDPQAELYKVELKYDIEKAQKLQEEEERNHQTSMGTLTSIPEIDLGMDNRLKNIEETEKAKRAMMEERKATTPVTKASEGTDFAAARFFQPKHTSHADRDALEDARRLSMGLPPIKRQSREKPEVATDEAVYERFKKRLRKH